LKLIRAATPPSIEIDCEVKGGIGEILADPTQIHQIVMNLCTNACHAMSANGGKLHLTVDRAIGHEFQSDGASGWNGDFVRLTVADTGHGIPRELMGKIFDPFFTTKEIGEGTGLGLSVVHSIVSDLEGHIQIRSIEREGTTVEILLPISRQDAGHNAIISEKIYYGNGELVIWLDDEEPLVTIGCHILKSLGYQPKGFSCPEECLKALRDDPHAFRLIFTDFNMPKMNGLVLAKKIREINSDIPIILCSGFSEEVTADNAKDKGLQDYLMKPARKHDIAMAAHKALQAGACNSSSVA
jgi:CheY-like chemotaxis protein